MHIDPTKMDQLIIKNLSNENLEPLLKMVMNFWPDTSMDEERRYFTSVITRADEACYLVQTGDRYIGFIHLTIRVDYVPGATHSPTPFIEGVYVDEKFRNQGVGKFLMLFAEKWAMEKGYSELASDSESDNLNSLEFHGKNGFTEVDRTVNFIKKLQG